MRAEQAKRQQAAGAAFGAGAKAPGYLGPGAGAP